MGQKSGYLICTRLKNTGTESLYSMNDIDRVAKPRSTAAKVCGCVGVGADIWGWGMGDVRSRVDVRMCSPCKRTEKDEATVSE